MGAGKTTIGRQLAERMGNKFVDSDSEIEDRTGANIDLIFEIEGEAGFRKREGRVIEDLTALKGIVLATGGGAVLDPGNRERLRQRGTVVYLKTSPRQLLKRTNWDRNRPLLQTDDRLGRIEELLNIRGPLYEGLADLIITTGERSIKQVVDEIFNTLKLQCRK